MSHLTVSQLAEQAGENVETVRYYERRRLISAPHRREFGYHEDTPQDVAHLQVMRRAKTLGFTRKEIAERRAFWVAPETTCEDIKERVIRKIVDVEAKIQALKHIKAALQPGGRRSQPVGDQARSAVRSLPVPVNTMEPSIR
ncbi:MAG TPA: MerR family transcriptional regulator [Alphaproteobacteria bacterium]|nr:MerR family transcriptional regulator [Alphaproteobacteria bacterium]